MKKRLLCYDEENPVGIDENGVLNPNALQPYYSKKVLFKTLTKDDFTIIDVGGESSYVYTFGSKLDWLTSEDSIHVEYMIETSSGLIFESSDSRIDKMPESPDGTIVLNIDNEFIIANGLNAMMEFVDDCMVVYSNFNPENIKQLKIDLYKIEVNKLSSDLVDGTMIKTFNLDGKTIKAGFTTEMISEIQSYYNKRYVIAITNYIAPCGEDANRRVVTSIDVLNDIKFQYDQSTLSTLLGCVFTIVSSEGVYRLGLITPGITNGGYYGVEFGLTTNGIHIRSGSGGANNKLYKINVDNSGNLTAEESNLDSTAFAD